MNLVGPTCRSAWTRGSASLPRFRGSMREACLRRILTPALSLREREVPGSTVGFFRSRPPYGRNPLRPRRRHRSPSARGRGPGCGGTNRPHGLRVQNLNCAPQKGANNILSCSSSAFLRPLTPCSVFRVPCCGPSGKRLGAEFDATSARPEFSRRPRSPAGAGVVGPARPWFHEPALRRRARACCSWKP